MRIVTACLGLAIAAFGIGSPASVGAFEAGGHHRSSVGAGGHKALGLARGGLRRPGFQRGRRFAAPLFLDRSFDHARYGGSSPVVIDHSRTEQVEAWPKTWPGPPVVAGIRAAPVGDPVLYVIETPEPSRRVLRGRDRETTGTVPGAASVFAPGVRVVSVRVPPAN